MAGTCCTLRRLRTASWVRDSTTSAGAQREATATLSTLQQGLIDTASSSGQLAPGTLELAPVNPAPLNLQSTSAPEVSVQPNASEVGPVDDREALHAGILGLGNMEGGQSVRDKGTVHNTGNETGAGKSLKQQVSFMF
jgi:hypothetical protein